MKFAIVLALGLAGCTEEQLAAFDQGLQQGQQRTVVLGQPAQAAPYCRQVFVRYTPSDPGQWVTVCGN